MITRHVFGRTVDFRFMPIADSEDVPAYALSTARIYLEEPTDAQKDNTVTTGAIGADVTTWTEKDRGEYSIAFPALTDASPHSDTEYETYFVTVRYQFEASGPVQSVTEQIFVWRPDAMTSKIRVTPADILKREAKLAEIAPTKTWLDEKIELAIIQIDREVESRGFTRKRTFNREKLNEATALLATALACFDRYGEGSEVWGKKYVVYDKMFNNAIAGLQLSVDVDGDDRPEPEERSEGGTAWPDR